MTMRLGGYTLGQDDLDAILEDVLVSGDGGAYDALVGALFPLARAQPRGMVRSSPSRVSVRPSNPMQAALTQAVANRVAQRGILMNSAPPDEARDLPLFFRATVTTLTQALITQRPQKAAFKPRRIVVSPSIAGLFRLNQVVIGVNPQQIATGGARADLFTPDSLITFEMDTATTSMDVIFDVNNISGADAEFNGMLAGPVVQG